MTNRIDRIVGDAVAQGVVDGALVEAHKTGHPWPVMVMTAFMTFLASIPICGLLFQMFFDKSGNDDTMFAGLLVAACAVGLLRINALPLFLEYFGVSLLGSGLILVAVQDFDARSLAITGVLALALTAPLKQSWIRVLLAVGATALLVHASSIDSRWWHGYRLSTWSGCHIAMLVWLGAHAGLRHAERAGKYAIAVWLESILIGAGITIMALLAYRSGSTFLVSGLLHDDVFNQPMTYGISSLRPWISSAMASVACAWTCTLPQASCYRRWLYAAVPVAIIGSWFADSLGGMVLMIVACLAWRRTGLAALGGVAALWVIGAMYYAVDWPLLHKSILLVGAGALLFASTWLIDVHEPMLAPAEVLQAEKTLPWSRWGLIVPALLVLSVTNVGIWQKEQVLNQGTTVFVELAPVDPRSLVQGDYMTLAFALPPIADAESSPQNFVVARRGEDGIATLTRFHDRETALAPDELLIEVTRRGSRPILVTDAWFFKEGEARRWEGAKYGEFRVDRHGKAVLVELRGPGLAKL